VRRRQQQLADDVCDDDAGPAVATYIYMYVDMICMNMYSLLHLECRSISRSNLNLVGLFSAERGKRGLKN